MSKQLITEEMGTHKEWYKEARDMTLEKLPAFLDKLVNEYGHDYGTIVHAIAAAAIGAAWAVDHSAAGGITGFQAGAITWEFIENWSAFGPGPKRLVAFDNMLYPQYETKFKQTISKETWVWLQEQAKAKLKEPDGVVALNVKAHWESIIAGNVPFGYEVA